MAKTYQTIAFSGALIGANLIMALLNMHTKIDAIGMNHIGEALSFLLLGGILVDLMHKNTPPFYLVPLIAFLSGLVYQPLAFLSVFNFALLKQITIEWIIYSIPIIVFIGIPILLLSQSFKKSYKSLFLYSFLLSVGLMTGFCLIYDLIL